MLNSNNPLRAAGIVALDLFNEFQKKGHTVRLLVNDYYSEYPDGIISMETSFMLWKNNMKEKVTRRIKFRKPIPTDSNYHFHELREQKSFYSVKSLLKSAGIKPDVILVLFAGHFVNTKDIYELNKLTKVPVFWLMYDMAPLTGGCHYAWDCKGYQNSCGNCPGLLSGDPLDISHTNILNKKIFIDKTDIHLITASEWQHRQAVSSLLFRNKPIDKILLSVDPAIFKPGNRNELRARMNIPVDKKVIFFGSVYLSHKRKGMYYLLESLKILKEKLVDNELGSKILLLVAGREIDEIAESLPFQYQYMGYLDNTYGIASAFQTADLFLCPSIEDSGPQMINQSIMCGTPVVAFEMGVSLDLVITGQTGYRARLKDQNDLAEGIYNILSQDENSYSELSGNCRKLALELCSPELQVEKIEKIIQKTLTR
jgi:glycosyltransferase involved in cell wall biosynthesis